MNTTTNTTDRTAEIEKARRVDTEVARLWNEFYFVNDQKLQWVRKLEEYRTSQARYVRLDLQIRAAEYEKNIEVCEKKVAELEIQAAPLKAAAIKFDRENYEGWSRFWLVKHIHNTQHCSSFRENTRVGWLPQVSGLTEVEAVSEYGATLCTICFPSAPVELTQAKVDPSICEGSGQYHSREYLTGRENAYRGKAGYCPACLRWQTLTATGNMRKHKKDEETRRHALDPR